MTSKRLNPIARIAAALVACAFIASCARDRDAPAATTDAVRTYGYGPQPNPSVTYQPDVILVSGGPSMIRGVSEDGLTWTIDGNAKEAADLRPGKIMFASARAVGRVVDVERSGANLVVSVAPVGLTEVIRNANLKIEQSLNQNAPLTGQVVLPPPQFHARETRMQRQPAHLENAGWHQDGGRLRRVAQTEADSIKVGNKFEVQPFLKSGKKDSDAKQESVTELGVKISHKFDSGVKLSGTASLFGKDVRVRCNFVIVDGALQDSSYFVIDGVEGLDVGFVSGTDQATTVKLRLEDKTIDTGVNFMVAGVPMALTFKVKAYVEFAYSSKNSTLTAQGRYKMSGPIGFERGTIHKPTLTLEKSMLQSITGHTIGPAGVVMATEFRLLIGVGNKDVGVAGGYGKFIVSVGVSQGSALGLPLAQCHGVTLKLDAGTGFGLEFNKYLFTFLGFMNRKLRPQIADVKDKMGKGKIEVELGKEYNLVNVTAVEPNIRLCGGGM
jgi:hypothetical protein